MSAWDELDRQLAAWMTELASAPAPARAFEDAMQATAREQPRPHLLAIFGSDWPGAARPATWPRPNRGRTPVAAVAIVTLLVTAAIGFEALGGPGVGGLGGTETPPSTANGGVAPPSPTATPTAPPSPTPSPTAPPGFDVPASEIHRGLLAPGTYDLDVDQQGFTVRFTVPSGWSWDGRSLSKGGAGLPHGAAIFFFGGVLQVYADPCHWAETPRPSPTDVAGLPAQADVSAFMAALARQPLRSATTPVDRPANLPGLANRWHGMSMELSVPGDIDFAACDQGQFRSWGPEDRARSQQGPGQRDFVWAVDISGSAVEGSAMPPGGLVIDAASFAGTPADVMSESDAILRSIEVGHWG
jgi:hypothetical protein